MSTEAVPKNVLVVEDDEAYRKTLRGLLEGMGFQVREAENGLVAKTVYNLNSSFFDLIVSDIRMPELDGISLLKHIRLTDQKTKFIMMTGFSDLIEANAAYDLGANEFLEKPFRLETFRSTVNTCFEEKTAEVEDAGPKIHYCQIPVEEFITSSTLVVDLFVRLGTDKYIRIARCGDSIPVERLKLYREKKVNFFYVLPGDLRKLVGLNLKISNKVAGNTEVGEKAKLNLLTSSAKLVAQSFYYDTIDKENVGEASQIINNTLAIIGDDPSLSSLMGFLQNENGHLFDHSVATSMFSCMIARKLGWSSQRVQVRLALGGLLHDIGKKELPQNLLEKDRIDMTPAECKIFDSHCQRGKEILSDIPGIPEDVIMIAAQHHENNNGTGFPCRLRGDKIHPLAKIIAVADCFLHMMKKLGVEDANGIPVAIRKMSVIYAMEYDYNAIRALASLMGVDLDVKIDKKSVYN